MRWMWAPGLLLFLQVLLCPRKPLPRPAASLCAKGPAKLLLDPAIQQKGKRLTPTLKTSGISGELGAVMVL